MSAFSGYGGFWRRVGAMIRKEFVQLRRDRITFATIVTIPLMQLVLFGYAINTQPRGLPTAVLLQESSDVGRSILKALENTKYFKITRQVRDEAARCRLETAQDVGGHGDTLRVRRSIDSGMFELHFLSPPGQQASSYEQLHGPPTAQPSQQ